MSRKREYSRMEEYIPDNPLDGITPRLKRTQWLSLIQVYNDQLSQQNGFSVDAASVFRMVPEVAEIYQACLDLDTSKKECMWRDCFCNKSYEVSFYGHIRHKEKGNILGQYKEDSGYYSVCLSEPDLESGKRTYLVHKLIAESWLEKEDPSFEINHVNGRRDDNCVINLEYVSRSYNQRHARVFGNASNKPPAPRYGEDHHLCSRGIIVDPEGVEYYVKGAEQFCRDNPDLPFNPGKLRRLLDGTNKTTREGWRLKDD